MAGDVVETLGERFKRLQEAFWVAEGDDAERAAETRLHCMAISEAFADYVLGLEQHKSDATNFWGILICDGCGRLWADDRASDSESCSTCDRFKQRMEWATPQEIEDADTKNRETIANLQSQLTAAQSERDEARREVKLLADDKSRLMDRIEQLERSKAAMQNRIDRLINKLEGR